MSNHIYPNPLAYSVEQGRRRINVSRQMYYNLINWGKLRTFKAGNKRLATEDAIQECIQLLEAEEAARK